MIEQDAETVNVAPHRGLLPLQHLGCEIEGRAGQIRRCVVLELSASAEVHQDDAPVFGSHHVVRLDVPMQQAGAVHRRHRATELETDADSFGGADHLSLVEDLLEGLAANELHPQADLIGNLLGAVDGDHVRMPHAGEQSAFVDDRGRRAIAGGGTGGQELQRDFAIEPRIPGAVHLSERAPADLLEEPKMTPCAGASQPSAARRDGAI